MADGRYEILAGHNRTNAAKLAGWTEIPAEIVEADDARAVVIATSTNLIQRQNLSPKQLNLACADLVADYDPASQEAFVEICGIECYQINKAAMQYIVQQCPPPTADRQAVFEAWRETWRQAEKRLAAPPKKISFERKRFAPYLESLGGDREIEALFLEFLEAKLGIH